MKAWLIYWCIGCAVVGFPMGALMRECPSADVKAIDVVVTVATWPAILFAAMGGQIKRENKCPDAITIK